MRWVKLNRIKIFLIFIATWFCFVSFNDVKSETGIGDECEIMRTGVPTVPESITYKDAWIFDWAENPPGYVERGGSVRFEVKGGTPEYFWQVVGQGFTLATAGKTESKTNTLSAAPDACGTATVTVTEKHKVSIQATIPAGAPLAWDEDNSAIEFPSGEPPVNVQVTSGMGPYTWEVSAGFTLQCYNDCGASNTLSSNGTGCIAEITVTDACGNQTTGKVRRPGRWNNCFVHNLRNCYYDPCNGSMAQLDFGQHLVEYGCCTSGQLDQVTGSCGSFEYTAHIDDCIMPEGCTKRVLTFLYIYEWVCY
ncbi:MAG: hypothetical protein ACYTBV_03100 [Planctomycetota bacterium]|jgi:hypothetical protein